MRLAFAYFSRTRSDTCPTALHQAAASPPVNGSLDTSSAGRPPRSASLRDEAQDVRAVALGSRGQRRRQGRPPHLVERDERLRAAGDGDGVVEEGVRPAHDQVRVRGLRRRADPLAEVHVPVHRCSACGTRFRRELRTARGDHDPGSGEALAPERDRPVGEVDPDRLRLGKTAGERARLRGGRPRQQRGDARGCTRARRRAVSQSAQVAESLTKGERRGRRRARPSHPTGVWLRPDPGFRRSSIPLRPEARPRPAHPRRRPAARRRTEGRAPRDRTRRRRRSPRARRAARLPLPDGRT